jgi:hypothetical protein
MAVLSLIVGLRSARSVGAFQSVQVRRDQRAKLDRPAADRLAVDFDSALAQEFLDITNAEREPEMQLHRLLDHFGRKPMTFERNRLHKISISAPDHAKLETFTTLPASTYGEAINLERGVPST